MGCRWLMLHDKNRKNSNTFLAHDTCDNGQHVVTSTNMKGGCSLGSIGSFVVAAAGLVVREEGLYFLCTSL
jgi:hypothetical protein